MPVAIDPQDVILLDSRRIAEYQARQLRRGLCAVNRPVIAALSKHWKPSRVVKVGMSDQHRIQVAKRIPFRNTVLLVRVGNALKHSEIDQNLRAS